MAKQLAPKIHFGEPNNSGFNSLHLHREFKSRKVNLKEKEAYF